MENLNQPFGMAMLNDTFYVGNTNGVVAFPMRRARLASPHPGETWPRSSLAAWTRSLLPSPDRRKLYVGVGSSSNIAENGMEAEAGRALIYEIDLVTGTGRPFAGGLRNAVGMAWEPRTGALWTVVNERDELRR